MNKMNVLMAMCFVAGLGVSPVMAEEALAVEVDVELMSETMTMKQAQSQLQGEIKKYRLKKKEAEKVQEALGKLVKEGVSVNRACEEVSEAVRTKERKRIGEIAEEGNIKRIKTQLAKEDIESNSKKEGRAKADTDAAVEVVEELIGKGVPIEKARDAVNKIISEGGDRVKLKQMLNPDALREMKREVVRERTRTNEDVDAARNQKESMGGSAGSFDDGNKESDSDSGNRKGRN